MPFLARIDLGKRLLPVRAYLHSAGVMPVYAPFGSALESAALGARTYLTDILDAQVELLRSFDFALAAVWGKRVKEDDDQGNLDRSRNVMVADIFGYKCGRPWRDSNPDMYAFVYEDGLLVPTNASCATTCGDTLVVLGREEEHRRTTHDRDEYFRNPPALPGLERIFVLSDAT